MRVGNGERWVSVCGNLHSRSEQRDSDCPRSGQTFQNSDGVSQMAATVTSSSGRQGCSEPTRRCSAGRRFAVFNGDGISLPASA